MESKICFGCVRKSCPLISNDKAICWIRTSCGILVIDGRYDLLVYCKTNFSEDLEATKVQENPGNKGTRFMLMKIGSYKERSHRLNSDRCCRTNSDIVRRIAAGVTINSSGPNEAGPVDLIFNMDNIVLNGKILNIKRGLIWTYGQEQVNYNFNKAGPWSNVDIYTGAAKDLITEAHSILLNKAPECNLVVRKSAAYNCDYMGSQRVNFSRGKQIASMAVGSLKKEGAKMEARLVLREEDMLICTVDQDLALLPYPSITYIHMDESLETPDHLLGIIAVIPETPPNCILIYTEECQDIATRISEKTGLPIGDEKEKENEKSSRGSLKAFVGRRMTTGDLKVSKISKMFTSLPSRSKSVKARPPKLELSEPETIQESDSVTA